MSEDLANIMGNFIETELYAFEQQHNELENVKKELDKYKFIFDKIKEYITTIDTDYAIGCWNKDDEFVDVKKKIF